MACTWVMEFLFRAILLLPDFISNGDAVSFYLQVHAVVFVIVKIGWPGLLPLQTVQSEQVLQGSPVLLIQILPGSSLKSSDKNGQRLLWQLF